MKKTNHISFSVGGLFLASLMLSGVLALSSCVKERKPQEPAERPTVWLSSAKPQLSENQDETTKTHWTGETIYWSEGDMVKVAAKGDGSWLAENGTQAVSGAIVESESKVWADCATTRFSVPSDFLKTKHENWQFYAVYPASCVTGTCTTSGGGFPVKIPQVQIPLRNESVRSYDPSADLLVGKTSQITSLEYGDEYEMLWKRAVAHLDLNFLNLPNIEAGEKLISIVIRTDQPLVNNFTLGADGELALPQQSGTDNVLTVLQRSNNIVLEENASIKDVWLCVRPCTISKMSVEILTDKAVYEKSWTGISRSFTRNRRNIMNVNMKGAKRKVTSSSQSGANLKKIYDLSFNVTIPAVRVWDSPYTSSTYDSTPIYVTKAIDLHIEVLPIYVFGSEDYSGDYYGISGYCIMHNGSFYKEVEESFGNSVTMYAYYWYMSRYNLEFQLLSSDEQKVSNENTLFFVTPEPSTTISSTTYNKGFSFSLSPKLTLGVRQDEDETTHELSWKGMLMGVIGLGFKWEDSQTQNLPDQSVELNTGTTRDVSYTIITNNDENGFGTKYIPKVARTDQRVDFSFVWHLKSGNFCAKDNDFGNMKLQIGITPVYKSAAYSENNKSLVGKVERRFTYTHPTISSTIDLPGMNRIPVGDVKIKNTTSNTMTNIFFYRSGEYGINSPYFFRNGAYNQNAEAEIMMREGKYDIVYELVEPNLLNPIGRFMIPGVEVSANGTTETSTVNAEKL
ncbi:MAG: hypothetical protein PUC92_04210 [bacterium]|nr:hypothetical protein [bacterium]